MTVVTYLKEIKTPQVVQDRPLIPLYIFDLPHEEIFVKYQLASAKCRVDGNRQFVFLYLDNGDRIDIERMD